VGTTHSVKACKEELLFNPIKNECDWAMNVNAKNKIQTDLDFKFKNKITKSIFYFRSIVVKHLIKILFQQQYQHMFFIHLVRF